MNIDRNDFIVFLKQFWSKTNTIANTFDDEVLSKVKSRAKKICKNIDDIVDISNMDDNLIKLAKKLNLIEVYRLAGRKVAVLSAWIKWAVDKADEVEFDQLISGYLAKFKRYFGG